MPDRDPMIPKGNGHSVSGGNKEGRDSGINGKAGDSYGSRDSSERIDMMDDKMGGKMDSSAKGSGSSEKTADPPKQKKFRNNRYATKKTAGQGLMGVSLITSNTSQLKTTLDDGPESSYYVLLVTLLAISLLLQVVVGILLMIIGSRESKLEGDAANKGTKKTEKLNDISTLLMFLITMVNATLAAFTVNPEGMALSSPTVLTPPVVNTTTPLPVV